ncbi:hypothetical protein GCM10010448_67250 [Streptomyces glomeratus]|uniref:Chaplin domain-containing protein n=1 Tax=Streptomyces glomeratus TaxID=284452 RepID=A0ABP6M3T3_9ACTN
MSWVMGCAPIGAGSGSGGRRTLVTAGAGGLIRARVPTSRQCREDSAAVPSDAGKNGAAPEVLGTEVLEGVGNSISLRPPPGACNFAPGAARVMFDQCRRG